LIKTKTNPTTKDITMDELTNQEIQAIIVIVGIAMAIVINLSVMVGFASRLRTMEAKLSFIQLIPINEGEEEKKND
jgi:hypothetical protein